jgi:histidinol-phosphate/aromatic aminotransferase/cobyric acid decarboxylase-like protein
VRPVPVRLAADGGPELAALAAAVTDDTRAVVLCSPNDPTGALVDRGALRAFAGELRPGVTVLVDEALVELAGDDASCAPLVEELPNLLVLRSFSKAWAMAGLRGGYAVGPAGAEELLGVLGPGQGVASPTIAGIAAALEDPDRSARRLERRRKAIAAERERLAGLLDGTPFSFARSHAHVVWLAGEGFSAASLTHGLAGQRVLVASGAGWGDDDHVRITLRDAAATERLAAALRALV